VLKNAEKNVNHLLNAKKLDAFMMEKLKLSNVKDFQLSVMIKKLVPKTLVTQSRDASIPSKNQENVPQSATPTLIASTGLENKNFIANVKRLNVT
jgi:hypothetical protein